jgi:hypothetical protein
MGGNKLSRLGTADMATPNAAIAASNWPDPKALDLLSTADNVYLALATLIAAAVLDGWMLQAVGSVLPYGWSLMKANTSLAVLFCTASLALTKLRRRCRAACRSKQSPSSCC